MGRVPFRITMRRQRVALALLLLAMLFATFTAQGSSEALNVPVYYDIGKVVNVHVGSMHSTSSLFVLHFYDYPFCSPNKTEVIEDAFTASILQDIYRTSVYSFEMQQHIPMQYVLPCRNTTGYSTREANMLESIINHNYRVELLLDDLPAIDESSKTQRGYLVGTAHRKPGKATIHNYLEFKVQVTGHPNEEHLFTVVGFTVKAKSVMFESDKPVDFSKPGEVKPITIQDVKDGKELIWGYSVTWEVTNLSWSSRWEDFSKTVKSTNMRLHIAHMIAAFTFFVVLILALFLALFRKAFASHSHGQRYELVEAMSEAIDFEHATGWKLIHADVFRRPPRPVLLSVMMGIGSAVIGGYLGVVALTAYGSRRLGLMGATPLLGLLSWMGFCSGFMCGYALQYFNQRQWRHVFVCASVLPGVVVALVVCTRTFSAVNYSLDSISLGRLLWLTALLGSNASFTLLGAFVAFLMKPLENPTKVGALAREIPRPRCHTKKGFLLTVPALVPLFTVYVELHLVVKALWTGQIQYVLGFVVATTVLWFLVTSLVTVFNIYMLLNNENHQWWWWAFIIPGTCGAHMAGYGLLYFIFFIPAPTFSSAVMYVLLIGIISVGYGLAAGVVGIVVSFFFLRSLYSRVGFQ